MPQPEGSRPPGAPAPAGTRDEAPFHHVRPDGHVLRGRLRPGGGALVVFLPGFRSVHAGAKAEAVAAWAGRHGHACLRFDWLGHGDSDGDFAAFRVSEAVRDAAEAIAAARRPGQPLVLVGSSMGAWIALVLVQRGLADPAAMVLAAPAVDFVSRRLGELPEAMRAHLEAHGGVQVPDAYAPGESYEISRAFLDDALALEPGDRPLAVACPVWILHGTDDEAVPVETARRLARLLPDARLTEIPGGDHRLTGHMDTLLDALDGLAP
jgi:pimeloyl-ACP methyl ester carboxylesterase